MEKIYASKTSIADSKLPEKPKNETITFILSYSKVLQLKQSKSFGTIDYLLN